MAVNIIASSDLKINRTLSQGQLRQLKLDEANALYHAQSFSEERPPVFKSLAHEIIALLTLTCGPSLATMNQGAMLIALPHVGKSFGISGSELSWTISAFALSSGTFVLLLASIADNIGRKRMVVVAYVWYALWCLVSGFMKRDIEFDVFRGLQGLSGAAAAPAAVGIIGATYVPGKRKNRAMATFSAGAPIGFIVGIICGGICTQFISWRAFFFFSTILYSVLAILVWYSAPDDPHMHWSEMKENLSKLDYFGALLATSGLVMFVFALTQSGATSKGWAEPYVIALLIVGIVTFAIFMFWESKAKNPLMPLGIWFYPGFALSMFIVACGFMNFLGVLNYYMTLIFQEVRDASAILTTAYLVPQAVCGVLVNVFAALTLHVIPGRILMFIAMTAFTVSALLWALQPIHLIYWAMAFPSICLSVVGADLAYNVANMHTLSAVPPESQSSAAGIFNTVFQLSAAIGIAASTTIVHTAADRSSHTGVQQLYDSYQAAFWFAVGVSGVGTIASGFLKVGTQGRKAADTDEEKVEEATKTTIISSP
ncbi:major facilitator superfamily domain-containing protein [Lipomyces kononenkoae]|uniref:Major facilitator superfamily domain-containing protein n=1 Tax=Lipomyces kononenkoae TaxID=34357 RepID=A0ACC3T8G6_LIPKO